MSTRIVTARLPADIIDQIDRLAREQSRTRTGQITHALRDWIGFADSAANQPKKESQRHVRK
jgi:predicted transcriptional regulator